VNKSPEFKLAVPPTTQSSLEKNEKALDINNAPNVRQWMTTADAS
jgi:hypothetical protein